MQSKKKLSFLDRIAALFFLSLVSFSGIAFAQTQTPLSVSSNPFSYMSAPLNYMMGTVSLPGANYSPANQNVPTNTLPGNVITPVPNNTSSCPAYLNEFNRIGDFRGSVSRLQQFLNEYNGANLNGLGYFGKATAQEVKNLQYAYGINPTGNQFEKTTALVNAIKCGQVAKKDRVIYTGSVSYNYYTASPRGNNAQFDNIYPNPTNADISVSSRSDNFPTKTTTINPPMIGKTTSDSGSKIAATTSTSSFFNNFSKDFNKVKENYKAYLLVFVLVLALFWFLRKAATE